MTQCPKCATALKEDYGMVTCPGCGSFLFIDMEGNAQMGQAEPPPEPTSSAIEIFEDVMPVEEPIVEDSPFANLSETTFETSPNLNVDPNGPAIVEHNPFLFEAAEPEMAAEEPIPAPWESPAEPEPVPEPVAEESPAESNDFSMDNFLGLGDTAESSPTSDQSPLSPDDPLGINEFANSELSQAKDGLLMYRITVSGIDSKEIRESIREAIQDLRFAWDASRIMAGISKGVLRLDQLAPVKASIFVSRIKRLPVKIHWEQYAITQSEPETGSEYSAE